MCNQKKCCLLLTTSSNDFKIHVALKLARTFVSSTQQQQRKILFLQHSNNKEKYKLKPSLDYASSFFKRNTRANART